MAQSLPPVAIFNAEKLLRFFKSTGLAVAQQHNLQIVWREYKDSTVLNAVYALMPWKEGPGYVEVDIKWVDVRQQAEKNAQHYLEMFLQKCCEGPAAAVKYLENLAKVRDSALTGVHDAFRMASEINDEIMGEVDQAVTTLKRIKAGSELIIAGTVIVTTGGAGLGAMGVGSGGLLTALAAEAGGASAVSLGYSVTKAVIEGWNAVPDAKAIAIAGGQPFATDLNNGNLAAPTGGVTGELGKEGIQRMADKTANALVTGSHAERLARLQGAAAEYERQLARARAPSRVGKLQSRLAERTGQIAKIQGKAAAAGKIAGSFFGLLFAGMDAYNAYSDLAATFEEKK